MAALSVQETSLLTCQPLYATLAKYMNFNLITFILVQILKIPVYGQLGLWWDRTSWQKECVTEEAAHFMEVRQEIGRKGPGGKYVFQSKPSTIYFIQLGPVS